MKRKVVNYTFSKASKQITFTDYSPVLLNSIMVVINVTRNIVLYQPNNVALGGTVATNVLTLTYNTNTAGFADTDKLYIVYDDTAIDNVGALETGGNLAAIKAKTDNIPASPATEGGNLASIKAKTDNIPAQGQALAANALPVVLPVLQVPDAQARSMFQTVLPARPATGVNTSGGTVTADYSLVALGTFSQSASYDLWITDIVVGSITDPTAELAIQPVNINCQYYINGSNAFLFDLQWPGNTRIHLKTPIKVGKGITHGLRIRLGGATALNVYWSFSGFETP